MNITSQQKKAAIVGAVVLLIGGGAFVYFDPLDLDLLGMKPVVVNPVAAPQPRPAKPATPAKPVAASAAAPIAAVPGVSPAVPALQPSQSATNTTAPVAPAAESPASVEPQPLKMTKSLHDAASKAAYPPSVDLRHCLDQLTPQDIAKCAGE